MISLIFLSSSIWTTIRSLDSPAKWNLRLIGTRPIWKVRELLPIGKSSPDDMISHLMSVCDRNVHDKGTIPVSASGVFGSVCPARNAADLGSQSSILESGNVANSQLCCDFKQIEFLSSVAFKQYR
jgi:hypothetical protein